MFLSKSPSFSRTGGIAYAFNPSVEAHNSQLELLRWCNFFLLDS